MSIISNYLPPNDLMTIMLRRGSKEKRRKEKLVEGSEDPSPVFFFEFLCFL
jgi:hypothetical protein